MDIGNKGIRSYPLHDHSSSQQIWWKCCDRSEHCEGATYGCSVSRCFLPPLWDRSLKLSSETKLKDLPPASRLFCAALPLCWVAFTTMRWKCDTVRWDSCLGLYWGVEVCVTYFQRLLAAPRTAAEDCYDSFPLRAQESIFSPRHFYSSSVTLIFPFSTVFAMLSFKQPRLGLGWAEKVVENITFLFFLVFFLFFLNNTWQV